MNRKKKIWVILGSVALVLLIFAGILFIKSSEHKTVHFQGYSISMPKAWETTENENMLEFFVEDQKQGSLTLLYSESTPEEIPGLLGYAPENLSVRESDQYVTKVYELTFQQDGTEVCLFVFHGLPNSPPYSAVLNLYDQSGRTTKRMLSGFSLPNLGAKPPEKPIAEVGEEFLQQAVYTVKRDTTVYAYHLGVLDRLIKAGTEQPADSASVIHILNYSADENGKAISTWYYLSVGAGEKLLYTYEQGENGYYYKNNPKLIREITRQVSAEENYTRYYADGELILEAPYNPYAENKEALLAYKDVVISDSSGVSELITKALPGGISSEGVSLDSQNGSSKMTIRYSVVQPDMYVSDGKIQEDAFYQNALVLFSLVENVDTISMEIRTGETVHHVAYEREVAEQQFGNKDLHTFTEDQKSFETFTEDVPKMTPPSETGSGNRADGTRILHTTTVTVTRSMKVRHPKSGKMVSVQPYAEKYGVTQYFDRPITIRLHEQTDAGNVKMWASATCGGSQIGTYPISSMSQYFGLLGMIQ